MKKNIGKKIDRLLSFIIIGILLPLFVTIICQRMQLEEIVYGEMEGEEAAQIGADEIEEQVAGIVANEIGMDANREVILAQCVIARTNLYDAREKNTAEPKALSISEMQTLWGENFDNIYQKLRQCVAETENLVLMWKGDYIYAAYHALSAGRTRDMSTLYGEARMPYLQEVLCKEDAVSEGYLAVNYWEQTEFIEKCKELFPKDSPEQISDIEIVDRDDTGYVSEVRVGGESCSGEEFRSHFDLNSACFTIAEMEGQVRVVTKGLGHGLGLSQNQASYMAEEGKSYEEILMYFYPGAELTEAVSSK